MLATRSFVAALVLIGGIFATRSLPTGNSPEAHPPLQEFPSVVSRWHGHDRPYRAEVVKAIGADDYINRVYSGGTLPIQLYIGYYKDQRSGDRIHSPKNCLPGSGWEPVRSEHLQIGIEHGEPVVVNEYLVEQGARRDMVLYWYQSRRRITASEYWAKYWLVVDGLARRTTDGALVRIWTTASDGEENARARATEFANKVYPQVADMLPQSPLQP